MNVQEQILRNQLEAYLASGRKPVQTRASKR